ncbi:hypothetical protein [Magnetospirillum sp. 64-120]|uniref:hypothetical protein n=1 Tax=Magnetospirillum sp. 64-120 TaxID=1895778 RepID=UPI000928A92B|nr:hypothetical protein [Magnetospirillum sp. 64-120]OJX78286.1 MAG: hypothetical protein BGO92_02635 [Magnetospirillum sp. 64-120]
MDVPYRSQYRSVTQRLLALRLGGVRKFVRRPLLQLGVAVAVILGATMWLHHHTPELDGGGTVDLRASAYRVDSLKAG